MKRDGHRFLVKVVLGYWMEVVSDLFMTTVWRGYNTGTIIASKTTGITSNDNRTIGIRVSCGAKRDDVVFPF